MSETKLTLTENDPVPFDNYPEGLEATAEYCFSHIKKDASSGKIYMSGHEIDLRDSSNLRDMLLAYIRTIYWQ